MIYIFPTTHQTQINKTFFYTISSILKKYNISLIAEEAADNHTFRGKTTQSFYYSRKNNIPLINIEMSEKVRLKLGVIDSVDFSSKFILFANKKIPYSKIDYNIYSKSYYSMSNIINENNKYWNKKRESYWLKKLLPYKNKNVLLIIGSKHYKNFKKTLNKNNLKNTTLKSFFILNNKKINIKKIHLFS